MIASDFAADQDAVAFRHYLIYVRPLFVSEKTNPSKEPQPSLEPDHTLTSSTEVNSLEYLRDWNS